MQTRLRMQTFNSNSSWTAPAGITAVIVYGMGGGSGGMAGNVIAGQNTASFSGGGVCLFTQFITVVPNTSYTITIGAGSAGGTVAGTLVSAGGDTTFGSLATFKGFGPITNNTGTSGVCTYLMNTNPIGNSYRPYDNTYAPGAGKLGATGTNGTTDGTKIGGAAGISGEGVGGNGGNGNASGAGTAGSAAAANSGAGGGKGGAGTSGTAAGGAGGSGQMILIWAE